MLKIRKRLELAKVRLEEELKTAASSITNKSNEDKTIVLVIGESTCRENLSLYGYHRLTTPFLDQHVKSGKL